MIETSFVVELVGPDVGEKPRKHFLHYGDALDHATKAVQSREAEQANIYGTPGTNAYAAIELVEACGAKLIASKTRQITPEEVHMADEISLRRDFSGTILRWLGLERK